MAQLYVVALILGGAQMVFQTADSALLPQLVDRQQLLAGNGALTTSKSASTVGGPGVAGLMVQSVGAVVALSASSLGFAASAVAVGLLRVRETTPVTRERVRSTLRREVADGLRYVYQEPILRVLTVNAAFANVALTGVEALFVPFLSRTVGLAPGAVGLLIGLASAGGVLGAAVAATLARRLGSARSILLSVLLCSPGGLLLPLTYERSQLSLFIIGGFVLFAGVGVYNVTVVSYRQAETPPQLLGRVTASMRVILLGAVPVGAALTAALTLLIGTRGALWVAVIMNLVPGVLMFASPVRNQRDLPSPRPPGENEGGGTSPQHAPASPNVL